MHTSGIACSEELTDAFRSANLDDDIGYMRIEIEGEAFVKKSEGKIADTKEEMFKIVAKELEPKVPCYMATKFQKDQWLLIYWVPDKSHVKKKMLIASSYAELKTGLGNSFFVGEYPISNREECTYEGWKESLSTKDDDELMTKEEKEQKEMAFSSSLCMSETKVAAVVGIAIPSTDEAKAAFIKFAAGEINTIIMDIDQEKEVLGISESGNFSFSDLAAKLPPKEPRYLLHNFEHDKDGQKKTKEVFVYYCPDKSKPRQRMFYSTAKSTCLLRLEEAKIPEPKRMEISDPKELTSQAVKDEIYPKTTVKKVFKKPTRQGKGRSKFMGKKFTPRT